MLSYKAMVKVLMLFGLCLDRLDDVWMLGFIKAFESKLNIFQRDLETESYKYFPRPQKNYEEFSEQASLYRKKQTTACHNLLCDPQKPEASNFTLSSLSIVVISKTKKVITFNQFLKFGIATCLERKWGF